MIHFGAPVEDLRPIERRLLIVLSVLVAITRLWGRSKSLWDWDEALFCTALTHYDVARHLPHPPGFPSYIALGRILYAVTGDAFRSLQTINLIAACALFPLAVTLGRELRLRFASAIAAALILCFAGNVWVFGGTAFSDVPALALAVGSFAYLLRGVRSRTSFFAASLLTATLLTIRPQFLMVLWLPWLIAACYRIRERRADPFLSLLVMASIGAVAYGAAAMATGTAEYFKVVEGHAKYIAEVDSYRSAGRLPLLRMVNRTFIYPPRAGSIDYAIVLLAIIGITGAFVRRRLHQLVLFFGFAPLAVFSFLMLDQNSFGRFSIAYLPLHAFFAAAGIAMLASRFARFGRGVPLASTLLTTLIVLPMIHWTLPALRELRNSDSPPVQAIEWLRQHADKSSDVVFVQGGMAPHVRLLLPEYRIETIADADAIGRGRGFIITDGIIPAPGAVHFRRPSKKLTKIVRDSYFDATVIPLSAAPYFTEGWYPRESDHEGRPYRWMRQSGVVELPPAGQRYARIEIRYSLPHALLDEGVTITMRFGGKVIDRQMVREEHVLRMFEVESAPDQWSQLVIETSRVDNPKLAGASDDDRDLGLLLRELVWQPAAPN